MACETRSQKGNVAPLGSEHLPNKGNEESSERMAKYQHHLKCCSSSVIVVVVVLRRSCCLVCKLTLSSVPYPLSPHYISLCNHLTSK